MRETWVRSLGWEDPLEKEIATHFNILAWESPWTEEPGRLQSMRSAKESDRTWPLNNNIKTLPLTSPPYLLPILESQGSLLSQGEAVTQQGNREDAGHVHTAQQACSHSHAKLEKQNDIWSLDFCED